MVRTALAEEERRLEERRATPRGGRRAADLVVDVPLYRVVSGKCAGRVVGEEDVVECDEGLGGCGGTGRKFVPGLGEMICPDCDGATKVLGYPSFGPPIRVVRLEGGAR